MKPVQGFRFLHKRWLLADKSGPRPCVVTRVLGDTVYWRALDGGASSYSSVSWFWRFAFGSEIPS